MILGFFEKIQKYINYHYDVVFTQLQIFLLCIFFVLGIVLCGIFFGMYNVRVDTRDMPIVPPNSSAPLFEKK